MEKRKLSPADCCREVVGATPHGGVRMVAHFYDRKKRRCLEKDAAFVQVIEYDAEGTAIFSVVSR